MIPVMVDASVFGGGVMGIAKMAKGAVNPITMSSPEKISVDIRAQGRSRQRPMPVTTPHTPGPPINKTPRIIPDLTNGAVAGSAVVPIGLTRKANDMSMAMARQRRAPRMDRMAMMLMPMERFMSRIVIRKKHVP